MQALPLAPPREHAAVHMPKVEHSQDLLIAAPVREQLADAIGVVPKHAPAVAGALGLGRLRIIFNGGRGRGGD